MAPYTVTPDATNAALMTPNANGFLCNNMVNTYQPIPYVNWNMTLDQQNIWNSNNCNMYLCQLWKTCYNVSPYQSWGSLSDPNIQASWNSPQMSCNVYSGPYNKNQCDAAKNAFGIIPNQSWGAAPDNVKGFWVQGRCYQ